MTVIVAACLATLGICALFSRIGQTARVRRPTQVSSLDTALVSLINDVSRQPARRRRAGTNHTPIDRVMIGSRLRAMDRGSQRITAV